VRSCPKCGSPRIHRSRSRNPWERFRKTFTHDRPHRCHVCGWRGWGPETSPVNQDPPPRGHGKPREAPDLAAIDVTVAESDEHQGDKDAG
jgi:hypothetical protein